MRTEEWHQLEQTQKIEHLRGWQMETEIKLSEQQTILHEIRNGQHQIYDVKETLKVILSKPIMNGKFDTVCEKVNVIHETMFTGDRPIAEETKKNTQFRTLFYWVLGIIIGTALGTFVTIEVLNAMKQPAKELPVKIEK